ncbi:hypothetical protein LSAT2_032190 [Lamellibrachia satsuma]|nr:hypothetical protein LSAT2_032190 [Lamellibrachia satsuma]
MKMCFVAYEMAKLGTFCMEYEKARAGNGTVHNKDKRLLDPDEVEYFKRVAKYEEVMASVFLLILIVTEFASLSVIRGASCKSRKNLVPWLLGIGPVCLYGNVLVVLDCAVYGITTENAIELAVSIVFVTVEVLCFRGVYRYYRHLAHEPHATTGSRGSSAVFTLSGGGSSSREGSLAVTLFPPTYEEVTVEGL